MTTRQSGPVQSPFKTVEFADLVFTIGDEAAGSIPVEIEITSQGKVIRNRPWSALMFITDDLDTLVPVATGVDDLTAGDGSIIEIAEGVVFQGISNSAGEFSVTIEKLAATELHLVVILPGGGLAISGLLDFPDNT